MNDPFVEVVVEAVWVAAAYTCGSRCICLWSCPQPCDKRPHASPGGGMASRRLLSPQKADQVPFEVVLGAAVEVAVPFEVEVPPYRINRSIDQ